MNGIQTQVYCHIIQRASLSEEEVRNIIYWNSPNNKLSRRQQHDGKFSTQFPRKKSSVCSFSIVYFCLKTTGHFFSGWPSQLAFERISTVLIETPPKSLTKSLLLEDSPQSPIPRPLKNVDNVIDVGS